jgi:probable F420-dependent oxidoreductase
LTWSLEMAKSHISEGSAEAFTGHTEPDLYDSIVSFSHVAALTKKIKLGFSVICLPFRNPVVLARQIATLDAISNGRVILGIGIGGWKKQFDYLGVPFEKRGKIMDEMFYALKEIWTKPVATFKGEYVRFEEVVAYPKPVQKPYPRILIGGHSHPSLRRVAEYADGWLPTTDRSVDEVKDGLAFIREKADNFGRGDKDFRATSEIHACIAKTDAEAIDKVSKTLFNEEMLKTFFLKDAQDILARTLVGSPATIVKKAESYREAGVDHFELKFIYRSIDDLLAQMEMVQERVVPAFR